MVRLFASALFLMLVGVGLTAAFLTGLERPTWEVVKLGAATVVAFAALVLGYNQLKDLSHPYWRRSPLEEAVIRDVFPILQRMIGEKDAGEGSRDVSVRVSDPRFPIAGRGTSPRRIWTGGPSRFPK